MASCVRNVRPKNYQNLIIGFQVTVKTVGDVFLRHSVVAVPKVSSTTECGKKSSPLKFLPFSQQPLGILTWNFTG